MHRIYFVGDHQLDQDFLFVKTPEGALIFYRESTLTAEVLESSWAAYRALIFKPAPAPDPDRCLADPPVGALILWSPEREWVERHLSLVSA